ncbi:hypothetical protein A9995_00285 [Erythrobacter sp. QSSC1-22B]|uniref:hypothetical protein n=1 Tax=Erythrobacter sp. QSSC1-22B TaxID=1860125 RepID=UPI00080550B2|nr:hypothetical protein [Erythrobacter sp. QSSC1-22B]OBX20212.1 hypothetical protein A9995_00285 [Erythrobacter sp. QSSC1-22B]
MSPAIVLSSALFVIAAVGPASAEGQSADPADTGVTTASNQPLSAMPSYQRPALAWESTDDAEIDQAICRDRIHKARDQLGQPELDREPATGDEAMAIWAVDRREDGCAVLVAMGDPEDIRPIPRIKKQFGLRPAN